MPEIVQCNEWNLAGVFKERIYVDNEDELNLNKMSTWLSWYIRHRLQCHQTLTVVREIFHQRYRSRRCIDENRWLFVRFNDFDHHFRLRVLRIFRNNIRYAHNDRVVLSWFSVNRPCQIQQPIVLINAKILSIFLL